MVPPHLDVSIPAIGIRQPWIELILRGVKSLEIRSRNTRIRGKIYLYSSQRAAGDSAAREAARHSNLELSQLPRGFLLGSVELTDSRPAHPDDAHKACVPAIRLAGQYAWRLEAPVRFERPCPVSFLPYGVWFYPFQRRGDRLID